MHPQLEELKEMKSSSEIKEIEETGPHEGTGCPEYYGENQCDESPTSNRLFSTIDNEPSTKRMLDFENIPEEIAMSKMCIYLAQELVSKALELADAHFQDSSYAEILTSSKVDSTKKKSLKKKKNKKKESKNSSPFHNNQGDANFRNDEDKSGENNNIEQCKAEEDECSQNVVSSVNDQESSFFEIDFDLNGTAQKDPKKTARNRKKKQRKKLNKLTQSQEATNTDAEINYNLNEMPRFFINNQSSRDSLTKRTPQESSHLISTPWDRTTSASISGRTNSNYDLNTSNPHSQFNLDKLSCSTPSPTPSDMSEEQKNRNTTNSKVINNLSAKLKQSLERLEKNPSGLHRDSFSRGTNEPALCATNLKGSNKSTSNQILHKNSTLLNSNNKFHDRPDACSEKQKLCSPMDQSTIQSQITELQDDGFIEIKANKKKIQKPENMFCNSRRRKESSTSDNWTSKNEKMSRRNRHEKNDVKKNLMKPEISEAVLPTFSNKNALSNQKNTSLPRTHKKPATTLSSRIERPKQATADCHQKGVRNLIINTHTHGEKALSISQTPKRDNFNKINSHVPKSDNTSTTGTPAGTSETKIKKSLKLNPKTTPLTFTSEADIETLTKASLTGFVNKMFESKLQEDIIEFVSKLTQESNNMMGYRITAFERLKFVIITAFKSNFDNYLV